MTTKQEKREAGRIAKTFSDPGNVLILVYISIIIFLLLLGNLATASAEDIIGQKQTLTLDEVKRGELLVKESKTGKFIATPLLDQKVEIAISGLVANATLRQQFHNNSDEWIEAIYVFPLPDESAVKTLRMVIGDRVIIGEIKEKQKAREMYEKAKSEGKKTSLLAQKRPNIFTMAVANIPPQSNIEVE